MLGPQIGQFNSAKPALPISKTERLWHRLLRRSVSSPKICSAKTECCDREDSHFASLVSCREKTKTEKHSVVYPSPTPDGRIFAVCHEISQRPFPSIETNHRESFCTICASSSSSLGSSSRMHRFAHVQEMVLPGVER